jgi:hypothetical protein
MNARPAGPCRENASAFEIIASLVAFNCELADCGNIKPTADATAAVDTVLYKISSRDRFCHFPLLINAYLLNAR